MKMENEYVEVTQELFDQVISPWFRDVNMHSDEYLEAIFSDPETGARTVVIEGTRYRMVEVVRFASASLRQFGESVGVKM